MKSTEPEPEWWHTERALTVQEVATFERISRTEVYRRTKPGDPQYLPSKEVDGKLLINVNFMSFDAQERWKAERRSAWTPKSAPDPPKLGPQRLLFAPRQDDPAALHIPEGQRETVLLRLDTLRQRMNGDYGRLGMSETEFHNALAAKAGVSGRTLYRWTRDFKATITPEQPSGDASVLMDRPPGPEAGKRSILNAGGAWMKAFLLKHWIKGLAKCQCYELLLDEIKAKQTSEKWRVGHAYPVPSESVVNDFLRKLPPIYQRMREGPEAMREALPIIDRKFDGWAGDTWCIDEWSCDGAFVLDKPQNKVLWHPYIISIIDQRSTKLLGWRLCDAPNVATVLELLEATIREYGRPMWMVSDKGGHFRTMIFGRKAGVGSHEALMGHLMGALGFLGVKRVSPGGEKNPQGNRIERRLHGFYANVARRDFGLSWSGRNTDERPSTGIDERVKRHEDYVRGRAPRELLLMSELDAIIGRWPAEYNAEPSDGNSLNGLSPDAVWEQQQPSRQELDSRLALSGWTREVSEEDLALAFAYRLTLRIAAHGIIQWPDKRRYYTPALLALIGQDRECVRLRHDPSRISILPAAKGGTLIIAPLRVRVGTVDQTGLEEQMEERAHLRKLAIETTPPPRWADRTPRTDFPEISGAEYLESKGRLGRLPTPTLSAEPLGPDDEAAPLPSLYEFGECKAEEL